jgi:hypothetical protein
MVYLLSLTPEEGIAFDIDLMEISLHFKIGRQKRLRILKELQTFGYIEHRMKRVGGRFDYQTLLHDPPIKKAFGKG